MEFHFLLTTLEIAKTFRGEVQEQFCNEQIPICTLIGE